jgi:hypothetical protein
LPSPKLWTHLLLPDAAFGAAARPRAASLRPDAGPADFLFSRRRDVDFTMEPRLDAPGA